ncbi:MULTISPECIES: hypothetical protein [unclassified Streptomyces]|uniref:hypothetical protein n=1 Tax=unclassified Streptomyces TaxID=2593676 RepID=UPI0033BB6389
MSEDLAAAERTALRGLLDALKREGLVPPEWERAARAVPRSAYVPERIYLGDDLQPCDRADAPETWLRAVYADDSVVTQINDGEDPGEDGERWASSSASAPGIVFRMLRMADVGWDGTSDDRFAVWQHGPRRLWDETEAAYAWWTSHDRPGPERFGLTVTATGETRWLDDPGRPVPAMG